MRVIVIGASGIIGQAVATALAEHHDVVRVARNSGNARIDITSIESIERFFQDIGPFDAVVSTAGSAKFGPFANLTVADFILGLTDKLMGQINLVRIGSRYINDNGSFTLTSGVLSQEPIPGSAAISPINGALESFARAAALELPRGIRINAVSPIWVTETLEKLGMDTNAGLSAAQTAHTYVASVEGTDTGKTLDVRAYV